MVRYALSITVLLAVIGWLVLSYLPGAAAVLPVIAFDGEAAQQMLPLLAALTVAGLLVIQLAVLVSTGRTLRHPANSTVAATAQQFSLRYGREMFLTALPLLLIAVLVLTLM